MRRAAYLGTFDPVTYGHIDVIERASKIFDKLLIGVAKDPSEKKSLFSINERIEMLKKAVKHINNVEVELFEGLAVNYVKDKGINVIIRGLRMISDFEFEFQMALTNRKLAKDIETIFMMTSEDYSYLSSKLIKETLTLGADVKSFVPPFVVKKLKEKLCKRK